VPAPGALSSAPIFIDCQAVIEIHELELVDSGGLPGMRDRNSLESAVAAPQQLHNYDEDADLVDMAATYLYAIAKTHAFNDGNKRSAYVTCLSFLDLNGINLGAPTALELATLAVASKDRFDRDLLDKKGLTGLLRLMVILLAEDPEYYASTYFRRATPARAQKLFP
jgi:death-on-curing protein